MVNRTGAEVGVSPEASLIRVLSGLMRRVFNWTSRVALNTSGSRSTASTTSALSPGMASNA